MRRGCHEEAERHRAVALAHRMMHVMGLVHTAQVTARRSEAVPHASMDKDVMHKKICDTVARHAQPHAKQDRLALQPVIEQRCSDRGKQQSENIIHLEPAPARAMMAFMDEPQRSVHDIAMREPRAGFHGGEAYGEHAEDDPDIGHNAPR